MVFYVGITVSILLFLFLGGNDGDDSSRRFVVSVQAAGQQTPTARPTITWVLDGGAYSTDEGGSNTLSRDVETINHILAAHDANITLCTTTVQNEYGNYPPFVQYLGENQNIDDFVDLASTGDAVAYVGAIIIGGSVAMGWACNVFPDGKELVFCRSGIPHSASQALFHELCHRMGLPHLNVVGNLMHENKDLMGTNLTEEQIEDIREYLDNK